MLTMLIGGLWHGASWNFVIWGGIHGVVLARSSASRRRFGPRGPWLLETPVATGAHALTFFLVCITWVFFRAKEFDGSLACSRAAFGVGGGPAVTADAGDHRRTRDDARHPGGALAAARRERRGLGAARVRDVLTGVWVVMCFSILLPKEREMPSSTSSFERAIPAQRWCEHGGSRCCVFDGAARRPAGRSCVARAVMRRHSTTRRTCGRARASGSTMRRPDPDRAARLVADAVRSRHRGGPSRDRRARPIQLATVGTNELYMLEKLAADPNFRGTAIVSFVPRPDVHARAARRPRTSRRPSSATSTDSISQRVSARMFEWLDRGSRSSTATS